MSHQRVRVHVRVRPETPSEAADRDQNAPSLVVTMGVTTRTVLWEIFF